MLTLKSDPIVPFLDQLLNNGKPASEWLLDTVMALKMEYDLELRGEALAERIGVLPVLGVVALWDQPDYQYFKRFDLLSGHEYLNSEHITDYQTQVERINQFSKVELIDYGASNIRHALEERRPELKLVRFAIEEDFDSSRPNVPWSPSV